MRNITVQSTLGERISFTSDAANFGELKLTLEEKGVYLPGMKCIVRGSNAVVSDLDSSVLPNEDFVLFIMPEKTKAGSDSDLDYLENVAGDIANFLDSISAKLTRIIGILSDMNAEKVCKHKDSIEADFDEIKNAFTI
jgi:hypothetical protein